MQSADRALRILSRFDDAHKAVRVSEIAADLGVHRSTAFRLLATLERRGFVRREGVRFRPGIELARIAGVVDFVDALVAVASGPMERLAELTGETVTLGVRNGDSALYVRQADGAHILGVVDWTGRTTSLNGSATGKVLVAFGGEPVLGKLEPHTGKTITDPDAWDRELRRTRARGYALMRDELEEGLTAVAAPVIDLGRVCVAAVSVSGPSFRLTRVLSTVGERCLAAAGEISLRLGAETGVYEQRELGAANHLRGESSDV